VLGAVKLRYRLSVLEAVKENGYWAVQGDVQRMLKQQTSKRADDQLSPKECKARGTHGRHVKREGSGNPQRAWEKKDSELVAVYKSALGTLDRIDKLVSQAAAAERAGDTETANRLFGEALVYDGKMQGYQNSIQGIDWEQKVAREEKPELRSVDVFCSTCGEKLTDLDLVKDGTVIETKSGKIGKTQCDRMVKIAEKLFGAGTKVDYAVPKGSGMRERIAKIFASSTIKPNVREY
jgi:hypothetical protein